MYIFGSGVAVATPYGAAAAANPSPIQLGVLQETGISISNSQKELMGRNQFPVAIARTAGKIELKFKFGNNYAKQWNDLFFGSTVAAGSEIGVYDFAATPSSSAITITPPSSGVFARNLGVRHGTNGRVMTLVASSPVAGVSYTFNTSTKAYGFNASDTGVMYITYTYTLSSQGFSSTVINTAMGAQPMFDVTVMNAQWNGQNMLLRFPAVIASKFAMPLKNEDWEISEFDCGAFQDTVGNVMYINMDE